MSSGPNLWWIFDSENDSFTTLPTGPFMVPALFLCAFLYFTKAIVAREHTIESIAGDLVHNDYWKAQKQRYDYLVIKSTRSSESLQMHEYAELKRLEKYLMNPYK